VHITENNNKREEKNEKKEKAHTTAECSLWSCVWQNLWAHHHSREQLTNLAARLDSVDD
jgi:hypothetical protein